MKFATAQGTKTLRLSLPVRGAWIEMRGVLMDVNRRNVAPRAGSVD